MPAEDHLQQCICDTLNSSLVKMLICSMFLVAIMQLLSCYECFLAYWYGVARVFCVMARFSFCFLAVLSTKRQV